MKSSLKLFFSLFLAAGSFTAFAASYTDGIEYFKAGQPDRAKILLERTLDDAGTNKAESYYYLGEIAFGNKDYTAAAEYYKKGLEADPCSLIISSVKVDRKSTRLNSSHYQQSRMPSSA